MQSRPVHGNIELQEYLPLLVDISLYGANEDTYYKVTGIHGAFNRVLMNCKKLKEAGIRVALKTPVLNETLGQIDEMKSIATKWVFLLCIHSRYALQLTKMFRLKATR